MFPQIPFVLDHLFAEGAGYPLRLNMNIDYVLFQVERVRKGLPTIVTEARLHASPSIPRMRTPNAGIVVIVTGIVRLSIVGVGVIGT